MERPQNPKRDLLFGLMCLILGALTLIAMWPFVPALLWATVLAVLSYGPYKKLEARFERVHWLRKNGGTAASLIVTILTLLIICIPFAVLGIALFLQVGALTAQLDKGDGMTLDTILKSIDAVIKPIAMNLGTQFSLAEYVEQHRPELLASLRQPAQAIAASVGSMVLTLTFAILTQFFMLRDGHRLREPAIELLPLPRAKTEHLFQRLTATIRAVFVGTIVVSLIQGGVIGIAYAAVGVPNAVLLGVVSALVCMIPMLGAPLIYVPVSLYLFSQGQTTQAIVLMAIGVLIVSQIDNVLRPFFIGGQVNLHPMAVFFSVLAGVVMFGAIGVVAGPMLLTTLLVVQDTIRERLSGTTPSAAPE